MKWSIAVLTLVVAAHSTIGALNGGGQLPTRRCSAGCVIEKQILATLVGLDSAQVDGRIVQDKGKQFAVVTSDSRRIQIFDARGTAVATRRAIEGSFGGLFVGPQGIVQAYSFQSGSLQSFDASYRVLSEAALPHAPALALPDGSFLVVGQVSGARPAGAPLHVMAKDGSIVRSFGNGGEPFRAADLFKNDRAVCLDSEGQVWSIPIGGRRLERWDPSTGRRTAQVEVKSAFTESNRPAPSGQRDNDMVHAIWADRNVLWRLYATADPAWVPRHITEREELTLTSKQRVDLQDRRFDWVMEAVDPATGDVVATRRFDRALLRREGAVGVMNRWSAAGGKAGVELWNPVLVVK